MSGVYNLKSTPEAGKFIVTKFDDDLNVESSYEFHNTTDGYLCHCPAGQRPSCRHRQMFPMLQARVDTAWFLDFDSRQWVDPTGQAELAPELEAGPQGSLGSSPPEIISYVELPESSTSEDVAKAFAKLTDTHPFRRRM